MSMADDEGREPKVTRIEWINHVATNLIEASEQVARRARIAFFLVGLNFAVIGIGFPVLLLQRFDTNSSSSSRFSQAIAYMSLGSAIVVITLATLVLLSTIDFGRRRSDALFETLSDELQTFSGRSLPVEIASSIREARTAIQLYSRSTDLPFIPGRYGVAIYAIVSIALGVTAVIFTVNAITALPAGSTVYG